MAGVDEPIHEGVQRNAVVVRILHVEGTEAVGDLLPQGLVISLRTSVVICKALSV
jgi:hypothetical protein